MIGKGVVLMYMPNTMFFCLVFWTVLVREAIFSFCPLFEYFFQSSGFKGAFGEGELSVSECILRLPLILFLCVMYLELSWKWNKCSMAHLGFKFQKYFGHFFDMSEILLFTICLSQSAGVIKAFAIKISKLDVAAIHSRSCSTTDYCRGSSQRITEETRPTVNIDKALQRVAGSR